MGGNIDIIDLDFSVLLLFFSPWQQSKPVVLLWLVRNKTAKKKKWPKSYITLFQLSFSLVLLPSFFVFFFLARSQIFCTLIFYWHLLKSVTHVDALEPVRDKHNHTHHKSATVRPVMAGWTYRFTVVLIKIQEMLNNEFDLLLNVLQNIYSYKCLFVFVDFICYCFLK